MKQVLPVQEQLKAIQYILNKKQFPFYRFNFGIHSGKTLEYVFKYDQGYLTWLLTEENLISDLLRSKIAKVLGCES